MSTRLPAEWERQSGVMLTWPHSRTDWQPILAEVEQLFIALACHITHYEKLLIVCYNPQHEMHIRQLLSAHVAEYSQISFFCCASNDSWARDHGPITIIENNKPALLDFQFNGWGNKFEASQDNNITACLQSQGAFKLSEIRKIEMILEGGSIESDGCGTLMTTSACLLSPQRNPHLSKQQVEQALKDLLGCNRILWLEHGGLEGDDTDSHIDTLARFCNQHTIVYQGCNDPADSHFESLNAMAAELATFTTPQGTPYKLEALPLPQAIYKDGQRLPASYANFLVINEAVILPVYEDPADKEAAEIIRRCFPRHTIITLNARSLVQQFGSIHCLTMQLAEGVL